MTPDRDQLYESNASFRLVMDATEDGGYIDLAEIHERADDMDPPTPEGFVQGFEHIADGHVRREGGKILADRRAALYYLQLCDTEVMRVCIDVIHARMKADPTQAAMNGGPFGAMFAQIARQEAGETPEDAAAGLVVDAMDRVTGLPLDEQRRIVAEVRANVGEIRPLLVDAEPDPSAEALADFVRWERIPRSVADKVLAQEPVDPEIAAGLFAREGGSIDWHACHASYFRKLVEIGALVPDPSDPLPIGALHPGRTYTVATARGELAWYDAGAVPFESVLARAEDFARKEIEDAIGDDMGESGRFASSVVTWFGGRVAAITVPVLDDDPDTTVIYQ